jgi:hypothetical protein
MRFVESDDITLDRSAAGVEGCWALVSGIAGYWDSVWPTGQDISIPTDAAGKERA